MAKVSLRIYNREIETMVDRGQLDEAIAHCRHILNVFPKCLETYRLLGKAYLEAKRYPEATDIFERLLMAVPDDFVAHVGMSIIGDEQKDLDYAIWHMERAFEVQPSNAAIQAELQRLFGRRDGVEPPKIRLNRGALAHMYTQGELYPQAIAEIKAVLEEDRDRHDMQVLLARAYFYAGQKSEAAETCAQLLRRYPYCLDANRVLVELLPEPVYRNRVNELDPYAPFATGSVFHTEDVPDAAVSLDRLEWDGEAVDLGPGWGESRGIGLGSGTPARDQEPDWLRAGFASVPTREPASASNTDNEIPDFLREAGWGKDSGAFKEGPGSFDTSDETSEEPALEEGDLPDWVKAMAPASAGPSPKNEMTDDLTQDDVPDWLQGLGDVQDQSSAGQPLEQGDVPDWLAAMKPTDATPQPSQPEESTAELTSDEDLPDWLSEMKPAGIEPQKPQEEPPAEPVGDSGVPDWLIAMKNDDGLPQEPQPEEPAQPASDSGGISDWLAAMKDDSAQPQEEAVAEPTSDEDLPDWLMAMKTDDAVPQESQPVEEPMPELASDENIPDWLRSMKAEEPAVESEQEPAQEFPQAGSETLPGLDAGEEEPKGAVAFDATDTGALGTSAAEQDDAIAWLESLASKHGAKAEELVTDPNARKETAPDWVQQARAVKEQESIETLAAEEEPPFEPARDFPAFMAEEPVMPAPEASTPPVPPAAGDVIPSAAEQDDAIAWLESLAAKHGAKAEELVTDPNARKDTAPDWVQQAAAAASQQEAFEAPVAKEEPPFEPAEEPPAFLAEEPVELAPEASAPSVPPATGEVIPTAAEQDDAIAWLESLASKHGAKPEELVTDPNARKDVAPEWVQKSAEANIAAQSPAEEMIPGEESKESIPDWIEPAPQANLDETGMWLRGLDSEQEQPVAEAETSSTGEDVPDWLRELEGEAPKAEAAPAPAEESDIPDWLRGLDREPAQAEIELPSGEPGQGVTDWLSEVEAEAPETEPETEAAREVPDWLLGVEAEQAQAEQFPSFPAEAEPVESVQEFAGTVDLNTASVEELAGLPGVGEFLAENIVAYREIYGPFASVDDLNKIVGMNPSTVEGLRGRVEVSEVETPFQPETGLADWFTGEETKETGVPVKETFAEEAAADDLPAWLAGLDESEGQAKPEPAASAEDDLPEWLRTVGEEESGHPEPTAPTDWRPAEISLAEEPVESVVEPEPEVKEPPIEVAPLPPSVAEPVEETPAQAAPPPPAREPEPEPARPVEPERPRYVEPVTTSRSGMTGMLSSSKDPALAYSQLELTRGNISGALDGYGKLIKRGKLLDEIIFDLREALYRYPLDVSILQSLGDAYMRANRLQDALDAYTKAEELLR